MRRVFADNHTQAAMRIHVVGTGLGIVFEDEKGRIVPKRRVRDGLDSATHGEVVVCDRGLGRGFAGTGARGVVVRQAQHDEVRHRVMALSLWTIGAHGWRDIPTPARWNLVLDLQNGERVSSTT